MEKNKIIAIAIIILLVIITVVVVNSNKNNKTAYVPENEITLDEETTLSLEDALKLALEECKNIYATYKYENFDIYFSPSFINENLDEGTVSLVTNTNDKDYSLIEIYDTFGNELETFPEVVYEKDKYEIEPNKTYLISIYSNENAYTYYYKIKIDIAGNVNLEQVCYTIGEENPDPEMNINLEETEEVIN